MKNSEDSSSSEEDIKPTLKKRIKKKKVKSFGSSSSGEENYIISNNTSKTVETRGKSCRRKVLSSDEETNDKRKRRPSSSEEYSPTNESLSDSDLTPKTRRQKALEKIAKKLSKKPVSKRKRIKDVANSSEGENECNKAEKEGEEEDDQKESGKGRKNIRKVLSNDHLQEQTKSATIAEKERRKRVSERQKLYNQVTGVNEEKGETFTKKLVLETDSESKEELIEVHPDLIVKLKPHQVEGVKFMWECTVESLKLVDKPGSGGILAHCMGLGKTLQVIVFLHTVLTNKHLENKLHTALIVCPYNTVLNWYNEFGIWLNKDELKINVCEMTNLKDNYSRASCLEDWQEEGGVMIMGYDMFRRLVQENVKGIPKRLRTKFATTLINPGPDIIVCDEGHVLKNENSALSKAASRITTKRRIILTGTPLQNNLEEYHCMVHFVKPHLLGTKKEFKNRFVNPISNGQCADSTTRDVKLMKQRVHILHKLLEGCVQRCDYSALTAFLPPKHEYVISVRMSDVQIKLYQYFLDKLALGIDNGGVRGRHLFSDFNVLRQIWTHPYILYLNQIRIENKNYGHDDSDSMSSFINDESSTPPSSPQSSSDNESSKDPKPSTSKKKEDEACSGDEIIKTWRTRSRTNRNAERSPSPEVIVRRKEWWGEYINVNDYTNYQMGGKLVLLLDILKQCGMIGDKVLMFSQSLLTLDLVEKVLSHIDDLNQNDPDKKFQDALGTWEKGIDYFRLDGSTHVDLRKHWIDHFNDEENPRARLFMISTKAGSLGTNLVGANRVIMMDASWNPTHDVQAIFRVYRFGQKKPVYIYRFLAQGTMEEKIYDRQVIKQSLSCRVIDEQQIERHFNAADLIELYTFDPDRQSNRPTPMVPKDRLLAEMLIQNSEWIVSYHEHDSLLQNVAEEDLTEEERKAAWAEYEAEKEGLFRPSTYTAWETEISSAEFNFAAQFVQVGCSDGVTLPNLDSDVSKIIQSIQLKQPNMNPVERQATLINALVILKNYYNQVYVWTCKEKQDYEAQGKPVPPNTTKYLNALNSCLVRLMVTLQSLKNQQSIMQQYQHQQHQFQQQQFQYQQQQYQYQQQQQQQQQHQYQYQSSYSHPQNMQYPPSQEWQQEMLSRMAQMQGTHLNQFLLNRIREHTNQLNQTHRTSDGGVSGLPTQNQNVNNFAGSTNGAKVGTTHNVYASHAQNASFSQNPPEQQEPIITFADDGDPPSSPHQKQQNSAAEQGPIITMMDDDEQSPSSDDKQEQPSHSTVTITEITD